MATSAEIQAVFDSGGSTLKSLRILRELHPTALVTEFYVRVNGPTFFSQNNNVQGRDRWVAVATASDDVTSAAAIFNSLLTPA